MKGERVNVNWWQVCGMCGWVVVHRVVPSVYIVWHCDVVSNTKFFNFLNKLYVCTHASTHRDINNAHFSTVNSSSSPTHAYNKKYMKRRMQCIDFIVYVYVYGT